MSDRIESGKEHVARRDDPDFTGDSPAHEGAAHLTRACGCFVSVLVGHNRGESKQTCLSHLDQALAWLDGEDMTRLDRTARWGLKLQLDVYFDVIDAWRLGQTDSALMPWVESVFSVLGTIKMSVYSRYDHWLRLHAQGQLSDEDLRRHIRRMTADDRLALDRLTDDLRQLRRTVDGLPVS